MHYPPYQTKYFTGCINHLLTMLDNKIFMFTQLLLIDETFDFKNVSKC